PGGRDLGVAPGPPRAAPPGRGPPDRPPLPRPAPHQADLARSRAQAHRLAALAPARLVQPAQDLHRLGAQLVVERPPVLLGELAGAVVELGVPDLPVLGLPRRL